MIIVHKISPKILKIYMESFYEKSKKVEVVGSSPPSEPFLVWDIFQRWLGQRGASSGPCGGWECGAGGPCGAAGPAWRCRPHAVRGQCGGGAEVAWAQALPPNHQCSKIV
jgi:hypothetical protein